MTVQQTGSAPDTARALANSADPAPSAISSLRNAELSTAQLYDIVTIVHKNEIFCCSSSSNWYFPKSGLNGEVYFGTKYSLAIKPDCNLTAAALLEEMLGYRGAALLREESINLDNLDTVPQKLISVVQLNSYRDSGSYTREDQKEHFETRGLIFADPLSSMLVCTAVAQRARMAGLDLSMETQFWHRNQAEAISRISGDDLQLMLSIAGPGYLRTASGSISRRHEGGFRLVHTHDSPKASYCTAALGVTAEPANS